MRMCMCVRACVPERRLRLRSDNEYKELRFRVDFTDLLSMLTNSLELTNRATFAYAQ